MALVTMNFESEYLYSNHEISIILPDKPRSLTAKEFYSSGKKYKVLWLLHGTFGDHSDWLRKSNIELYACEKDLIVVMPSALNSNYSDWPDYMIGYKMFSYLTEEVEIHFQTFSEGTIITKFTTFTCQRVIPQARW